MHCSSERHRDPRKARGRHSAVKNAPQTSLPEVKAAYPRAKFQLVLAKAAGEGRAEVGQLVEELPPPGAIARDDAETATDDATRGAGHGALTVRGKPKTVDRSDEV